MRSRRVSYRVLLTPLLVPLFWIGLIFPGMSTAQVPGERTDEFERLIKRSQQFGRAEPERQREAAKPPPRGGRPGAFDDFSIPFYTPTVTPTFSPVVILSPTPRPRKPLAVEKAVAGARGVLPVVKGALLQLSAETLEQKHGERVAVWRGAQGQELIAFSLAETRRPLFDKANSRVSSRLIFDGELNRLVISDLGPYLEKLRALSIIVVARVPGGQDQDLWGINIDVQSDPILSLGWLSSGIMQIHSGGDGPRQSRALTTGEIGVYTVIVDSIQLAGYANGQRVIVSPLAAPLPFQNMKFMVLGMRGLSDALAKSAFAGALYDVLIYDHALSPVDRALLEGNLMNSYGIAAAQ